MGSSDEDVEDQTLREAFENDLYRLRLIQFSFKKPKRGELPELDPKTGMMKVQSTRITDLGRLLLRYIDMAEDDGTETSDG